MEEKKIYQHHERDTTAGALADIQTREIAFESEFNNFIFKTNSGSTRYCQTNLTKPQIKNVKDFGVVGDGVTNDSSKIADAISSASSSGGNLLFPKGEYNLGSDITISSGVKIIMDINAYFSADAAVTVAINGELEAGNSKVFGDNITATFNGKAVPRLNIMWFGATGDGTTDDTDAINKAIQVTTIRSGNALTPGTVYIPTPNSSFYCASGLYALPRYGAIIGDGYASAISVGNDLNDFSLINSINADVIIRDLRILGKANNQGTGMKFGGYESSASTGTATTDTTNKLVDTGATFSSDGVEVGEMVMNTSTGKSGFVKAVDSETTLSIKDSLGADLDLFPDGNEKYKVGGAISSINITNIWMWKFSIGIDFKDGFTNTLDKVKMRDCGTGLNVQPSGYHNTLNVLNCRFQSCVTYDAYLEGPGPGASQVRIISFINTTFDPSPATAHIFANQVGLMTVQSCYFEETTSTWAIDAQDPAYHHYVGSIFNNTKGINFGDGVGGNVTITDCWSFATAGQLEDSIVTASISGTADSNVLNKLVDTAGPFTGGAWNVTANMRVFNTTDGTMGYVKAVDSASTLSIMDSDGADLDLFPLGTETYAVARGTTQVSINDSKFLSRGCTLPDQRCNIVNSSIGSGVYRNWRPEYEFPELQISSSDANVLDDYREGSWTPSFATGFGAINYVQQTGRCVKIGSLVYMWGAIQYNTASSFGAQVTVTLPYSTRDSSHTLNSGQGILHIQSNAGTLANDSPIIRVGNDSATAILQTQSTTGAVDIAASELGANAIVNFSLTIQTD